MWDGAPLCNTASDLHSPSGNMSGRVLLHCPHLMNAVPQRAIERVTEPYHTCDATERIALLWYYWGVRDYQIMLD